MARHDLDLPGSYLKMLCDEFSHRHVGLIVDWCRSRPHEQTSVALATHLVSPGSRNDSDREQSRFVRGRHWIKRRTYAYVPFGAPASGQ